MIIWKYLAMLLSGILLDVCAVGWVHFSERGKPVQAMLLAMLQSTISICGITEAIRDWHTAPFYIIGFGIGSYMVVSYKNGRKKDAGTVDGS